jgi:hypothetical protein
VVTNCVRKTSIRLDRTNRARGPASQTASARDGRTMERRLATGSSENGTNPDGGSSFQRTEKT